MPASCANLGPGFDILALAIDLCNDLMVEPADGGHISIDPGPGSVAGLGDPLTNLIVRSYLAACIELAVPEARRGMRFTCVNRIPLSRGLGSSAAAIVAGVLAAQALAGELDLYASAQKTSHPRKESHATESSRNEGSPDREGFYTRARGQVKEGSNAENPDSEESTSLTELRIAAAIEGHPENVAAAVLGGLVICAPGAEPRRLPVSGDIRCVLLVPAGESSTGAARASVPSSFTRKDAIFNASRCALLVRAFASRDYADLRVAMQDRWHQPYRGPSFPALEPVMSAARLAGAYGAALSGAGSSILAFASAEKAPAVATAMSSAAERAGTDGQSHVYSVRNQPALCEKTE
ncbi:MAG TPA: homoserine kinase [Chloroflexota bacterium]|nr:homoserine kinase [Chloroflexota bacterium]